MLLTLTIRPRTVAGIAGWAAAGGAVLVARHWRTRHRALTTLYQEATEPWPLVASEPRPGKNRALRKQLADAIERGDRIEVIDTKGEWP